MGNRYRLIDFKTWKRKEHFQIYSRAVKPQYSLSFNLDVTKFKTRVKENHWSFSMAFIFAVTKCANEIEEFRYRFLDGEVVLYESIDPLFTYIDKTTELFKLVRVSMQDTIEEFVQLAGVTAEGQIEHFPASLENDTYQFSPLPWIAFTDITHTDFGNRENAQPLFSWGKYYEKEGKFLMPFSVQIHHGFVDGIHLSKLADKLQRFLDEMA